MGRTADNVISRVAFSLEQQVGLANGVGLGVDLLAVEMGRHLLAALAGDLLQRLFGDRQHTAGTAGSIIEQVRAGLNLVGDRQKDELGHQLDSIARRPVLARLFVVLLVEAPHQLLKDRAHAVVVETGQFHRTVGVFDRVRA